MLIIAHHHISDPEGFWKEAQNVTTNLPANLKLHSVYPSADGKTGTCVWEGPDAKEVQKFLDEKTGSMAKNFCYEVNEGAAMGTPKSQIEAIHN